MASVPRIPRLPSLPPMWREARTALELAALVRDPVFRGEGVADGRGHGVLLVPGFLAGDDSLGVMTAWLRRAGYRTRSASLRMNVNCSGSTLHVLERRLEELCERSEGRATIVGQSRGGTLGRALAVRRPDLVAGLVALGSPQIDPFAVHPLVMLQLRAVSALGTLGVPGLFRAACLDSDCCSDFRTGLETPVPKAVGYVSVYSRTDGVVDWRSCLDPDATHVEVDASHIGMAVNPVVYRAVGAALAQFAAPVPV